MKKRLILILSLGFLSCGVAFGQISGYSNQVTCYGGADGSITIINTGNLVPPISYNLQPGSTSSTTGTFSGISAGTYTVQATDANSATATTIFNIIEPTLLVFSVDSVKNVSCFGSCDGYIQVNAQGGTAVYSFGQEPGNNYNASGIYSNLCAGNYTVSVADANGCSVTSTAYITQPTTGITQSIDSTFQPNCGDSNGYIKLNVTANGPFATAITPNVGTQTIGGAYIGLPQGIYTITHTDANSCVYSITVPLNANNNLTYNYLNASYPTCFDGNDGTITTLANGALPITYSLINTSIPNNTTGQFSGISSGVYTIKASDANGCIKNTSINIFNPSPIAVTVKQYAASCNGGDGAVKLISFSNYGPSTYSIQPAATAIGTDSFVGLSYGTYTITVQDAIGCSNTQTFTMSKATAYAQGTQQIDCHGDADGAIRINTNANFNYFNPAILQPGNISSTDGSFSGLAGGTYSIYLNDGNGCLDTVTVNMYEPPAFNIAIDSILLPSAPTANDGYLKVQNVSNANYWLTNSNNTLSNGFGTFNNILAGIYTLKVKRFNCELDTTINLQHPTCSLSFANVVTQASSCSQNNGSIQLGIINGNGPVTTTHITSTTNNPAVFSNIGFGTKLITATDSLGCTIDTTINITMASSAPTIDSINTQKLPCYNSGGGSAQVFASGGSGAKTYFLNNTLQQNTTGLFTNLPIGNYTVHVQDDSLCQSASSNFSIQNAYNFNPTITATPSSCNTNCNGKVELFSTSTFNYTPQLDSFKLGNIVNTSGVFDTLCAGNYPITIYYDSICIKNINANVAQSGFQIVGTNKVNPTCPILNNGSLSLNLVNGTPPYQYSLNGGAYQSSAQFNNLAGGAYTVTVKDALNCGTASTIVSLNTTSLIVSVTSTVPSCVPGADASATVSVSGGTPPYQYNLGSPNQSSNIFQNLGAGSYNFSVSDINGCTGTQQHIITPPQAPIINNVQKTNVSCNGGSNGSISVSSFGQNYVQGPGGGWIASSVGGGGPGIIYSISPNAGSSLIGQFYGLQTGIYTITVSNTLGCTATQSVIITEPQPTAIIPSVTATTFGNNTYGSNCGNFSYSVFGKYPITVSVYDSSYNLLSTFQKTTSSSENLQSFGFGTYKIVASDSCGVDSITAIYQPNNFSFNSIMATNVACNGANDGSLLVSATGGTGTIVYSIIPTVGAPNTTGIFSNLPAQNYTITATDVNACAINTVFTIIEPVALGFTQVNQQDIICFGANNGIAQVQVTGGMPPYNYTLGSSSNTTGQFNNLPSGNYGVTVSDANGCTVSTSIFINEPPQIAIQLVSDKDPGCNPSFDGEIQVSAFGGTGSKIYSIAPVAGQQINPGTFMNLPAGIYTITAIDGNNCSAQIIDTLQYVTPPTIIISNSRYESCIPGNDGHVTLSVEPAQNTYQFSIDSIAWSGFTNGRFYGNLQKGNYTFYARDIATNCFASLDYEIKFINNLTFGDLDITHPSCFGTKDGSIRLTDNQNSYSIFPNAGVKTDALTFNNLQAGTYNIIGTDAKGCTGTSAGLLINPDSLLFKKLGVTTTTNIHCYAAVNAEVIGGTPNYKYSITPNKGKQTTAGLFEGLCWETYTVNVRDNNGCSVSQKITIKEDANALENIFDSFEIFPNPADRSITLRSSYLLNYNVKMFDLYGNAVMQQDVYQKEITIPTAEFAAGMYILRFKSEVDVKEFKIMIVH